ncbi:AAA family ATPase [Nocardioides sp. LHD-245]|uniref:ATP-binding protein n=1 Tax=Nocardioides sp. LHD-245 TaxID=3051387 RepID=UPI0027E0C059|nr:AAA family ATPase [Nocardioides sp. LHD-245]
MDEELGILERSRELDVIEALVVDAAAGRGSALFIAGPPGIGKSALLHETVVAGRAAGLRVLSVRLQELDGAVPFGVVRDLLAPELAGADPVGDTPLIRQALDVLGHAWPVASDSDRNAPISVASARHALYWLVAALADRTPLLLAVDDVHWADPASLGFLLHLARRIDGLPVALATATRRGDVGGAAELAAGLGSPDRVLLPRPLSAEATAVLVRAEFGAPDVPGLAATLHACTAGNPLALHASLAALRDTGAAPETFSPELVRRLGADALGSRVRRWLDAVSPAARECAEALAVVGDIGGPAAIGSLIGVSAASARRAIDELVAAELLRSEEWGTFAQPLIRSAISDAIAGPDRDRLGRRAAAILAERSDPVAAAGHLMAVRPAADPWVVETLERAARISADRGAPDVAITLLRRAVAEPAPRGRRVRIWAALGRAQLAAGDPNAVDSLRRAIHDAGAPRERAVIARDLAQALVNDVRLSEAVDVLRRAAVELRAVAEVETDRALVDEIETRRLMFSTWDPVQRASVRELLAAESDRPVRQGAFAQRMSLMIRAFESIAACRPADEGATLVEQALADGSLSRDAPSVALMAVPLLGACGRVGQARRHVELAIVRAQEDGVLPELRASIGLRGQLAMLEGDVLVAETDGCAMQELIEEGELGAPYLLGFLTEALLAQGRVDEAEAHLRQAGLMVGPLPDLTPLNTILLARGRVRVAQGELYAGLEDLLCCGERQERAGQTNPALNPWRAAAVEVLARLGRHQEAVELAEEDLDLAGRFGADHVVGAALLSRAGAGGEIGDVVLLEEARTLLTRSFARLTLARTYFELGRARLARGEGRDARTELTRALGLARQLSATHLAARATEALVAAGGRPRPAPTRAAEALTPAERRVAELAATGARNREIAQALFVTEKTVETHLRHSFRKLGLSSRAQLPAALAGPPAAQSAV